MFLKKVIQTAIIVSVLQVEYYEENLFKRPSLSYSVNGLEVVNDEDKSLIKRPLLSAFCKWTIMKKIC